jgi:hypothetical protein
LGQVAVQELEYLQSVVSKLDQAQGSMELDAALDDVAQAVTESNQRIKDAYLADFGTIDGAPQLGQSNIQGAAPPQNIGDGTVIENDAGERLIMRGGQWQPQ